MSTPQALAKRFGIKTADAIDPPAPKPPKPDFLDGLPKVDWSPEKNRAFQALGPHAVYVSATDGPVGLVTYTLSGQVHNRFGHNRGCWPCKLGTTGSWRDNVSSLLNRGPLPVRVQRRVWTLTESNAGNLAFLVTNLIHDRGEAEGLPALPNGYQDLGPDIDMDLFQQEIVDIATRQRVMAWTDAEMSEFCGVINRAAVADAIPINAHHPLYQRLIDRLVDREIEKRMRSR
jgi:hypothetical protein